VPAGRMTARALTERGSGRWPDGVPDALPAPRSGLRRAPAHRRRSGLARLPGRFTGPHRLRLGAPCLRPSQRMRRMPNGEGGIRTRGTVTRTHAFQACPLGHSGTSPHGLDPNVHSDGSPCILQANKRGINESRGGTVRLGSLPRACARERPGNTIAGVSYHKRAGCYIINPTAKNGDPLQRGPEGPGQTRRDLTEPRRARLRKMKLREVGKAVMARRSLTHS
jgi:hypothetical protein